MKYLLIPCLLFATAGFAKTYDFSKRFGIGGGGGLSYPLHGNDFDDLAGEKEMWNAHIRYNPTTASGFQLNYSQLDFDNTDINARMMDLMWLYRFNEGDRLTPFLGLGAGAADMSELQNDSLKFASRARLGFDVAITDDLLGSVFADYQYIGKMPGSDEDSTEGIPGQELFALIPQVGLTFFFGPDKEVASEKSKPAPAPVEKPVQHTTYVVPAAAVSTAEMDDDGDRVVNAKDKCPGTEAGATVNDYGCLPEEKASMTIEVLFPSGGSTLGSEANPHLDELAAFLEEHKNTKIEIQGHTDNTGSKKRNKELSELRANAVKTYLIEKAGVAPSRVSSYGYGDEKPIEDNTTAEGRAKNRRVIGVISQ